MSIAELTRVLVVGTIVSCAAGATAQAHPAAPFQVQVQRNVPFTMRDGTVLATDLYLPVKDGTVLTNKLPTVLQRTPYDKQHYRSMGEFFASHGYLSAVQDCRGRFASEGEFWPFVNEPRDGFDTIELLAKHPQSSGRVGMYGCSYMAWVQLEAATQAPPQLVTIIPYEGPINGYHYSQRGGGALHLGLLKWVLEMVATSKEARTNPDAAQKVAQMSSGQSFLEWAERIPWKRGETPLAAFPQFEDIAFQLYFENLDYNDFWRQPGLGMDEHFEQFPAMPILWVTAWYDWYPRTLSDGYQRMVKLGRRDQYLLIGPWTHNNFSSSPGEINFGDKDAPVASYEDFLHHELAWFDRWLKNDERACLGKPVKIFVMGGGDGLRTAGKLNHGGAWHFGDAWPPRETRPTKFYLQSERKLADTRPTEHSAATSYTYDPGNTVSSNGRCIIAYGPAAKLGFSGMGPRDQIELETLPGHGKPGAYIADRPDVLCFRSDPLPQDLRIAGDITAELYVSSDASDTDFFVKLIDEYPAADGRREYAFPVSEGILRARYRDGFEQAKLMTKGEIYRLAIPLEPSANIFKAGHRVRIDVMSSNFPNFDINRNTGNPGSHESRSARNTIHHDQEHPTAIVLPLFPL